MIENSTIIQSSFLHIHNGEICIRLPIICLNRLSEIGYLNSYSVEYAGNYYLKPEVFHNREIIDILINTPLPSDNL